MSGGFRGEPPESFAPRKRGLAISTNESRTFLIVDAENLRSRPDPLLMAFRASLHAVVDDALKKSGVPARRRIVEDRGSCVLVMIEAGVPKPNLVGPFMGHLVKGLALRNKRSRLNDWLRLRVGLHFGDLRRSRQGWAGPDLVHTFRLAQAEAVKRCLVLAARAQCVLVMSDLFYRHTVPFGGHGVDPTTFRSIDVSHPGGLSRAWVHVPGYSAPPLGAPSSLLPDELTGPPSVRSVFTGARAAIGTVRAARDPLLP